MAFCIFRSLKRDASQLKGFIYKQTQHVSCLQQMKLTVSRNEPVIYRDNSDERVGLEF